MQDRGEKPADRVGLMTEIKQIIVGVDGSDNSRAAMRWAYDEAAHHGASLNAVMVWHAPVRADESAVRLAAPRGVREPARAGELQTCSSSSPLSLTPGSQRWTCGPRCRKETPPRC